MKKQKIWKARAANHVRFHDKKHEHRSARHQYKEQTRQQAMEAQV